MSYFRMSELQEAGYPVRELFPWFNDVLDPMSRRQRMVEQLTELARAGDISIVELMNQENEAAGEMAGQVILGQQQDPGEGGLRADAPIPQELREYRVKVRSIEYEQATQERGKAAVFVRATRTISWQDGVRWAGYRSRGRARVPAAEDNIIETNKKEKDLLLQDAWRCLRQGGAWCKRIQGNRLRSRQWWYEEVLPSKENKAGQGKR